MLEVSAFQAAESTHSETSQRVLILRIFGKVFRLAGNICPVQLPLTMQFQSETIVDRFLETYAAVAELADALDLKSNDR